MNYATEQMPANLIVSGLSTLWWHYHCGSTCAGFKSCRSPDHCPSPNRETRFRNQISTDPGTLAFPTPADKQSCTKHFSLDSVLSSSLRVPAVLNKLFPFRFCWGRTSFLAWTALVGELDGRRGTWWHGLLLCVPGVALTGSDVALSSEAALWRRGVLRGKRGVSWHPPSVCVAFPPFKGGVGWGKRLKYIALEGGLPPHTPRNISPPQSEIFQLKNSGL